MLLSDEIMSFDVRLLRSPDCLTYWLSLAYPVRSANSLRGLGGTIATCGARNQLPHEPRICGGCVPIHFARDIDLPTIVGIVLAIARGRSVLWGGKTARGRRSAMLTPCLTFSGSCPQPCKPWCAHARIWSSRTCSYVINSPCSPGRLDAVRLLSCASGTSCCGSWLVDSAPAGASTCLSSRPRRSSAGIGRPGACSGVGSRALAAAVLISPPRCAT